MKDMSEGIFQTILTTVSGFLLQHIIFIVLIIVAWFIIYFNKFIDSFVMKHDRIWITWYHAKYRCPKCHKKLKPDDVPPNYYCKKCAQIYAFGDKPVKDWVKNKPFMTKGELLRRSLLLVILLLSVLYLVKTFWPLVADI